MDGVEHRSGTIIITLGPDDAYWLAGELPQNDGFTRDIDGFTRDILVAAAAATEWQRIHDEEELERPSLRVVMVERTRDGT